MGLSDYVLEYLRDAGVRKVFVVYGAACGDLIDSFSRVQGIDYIAVMHEQAGAFAVETYSKLSGRLCAAIVTSGPGGTNLLTGIANAYYDSVTCIFVTGQINSRFLTKNPAVRQVGFQENNIVAMAKPITKMAVMVENPTEIKRILADAVAQAVGGRPGPVLIDIPMDVQKANVDPDTLSGPEATAALRAATLPSCSVRRATVQAHEFLNDLSKSDRPVLLVGGGVRSHATVASVDAVRQMAEILQIPCLCTWNAIDIATSDWEMYRGRVGTYGGSGRNFAIQNSDLLLCIGTRISGRITGGNVESFARAAKKYIIDIDTSLLNTSLQQVRGDVNIYCDAERFARIILDIVGSGCSVDKSRGKQWLDKTLQWRDRYQPCLPEYYKDVGYVHPYVFMKVLSEELEAHDIVIADCGGNVVVTFQTFETKYGQRVCSSHGNSPMGYSFAGAIGACFIPKAKYGRVICLIGDGGFNMNIQELQTVVNYDLPVKTFIMNNHCYGITRQFQDTNYEGRHLASGPDGYNPPDFVKVVKAYGIRTETIKSHKELRSKIRKVISHPGAIVCDVDMGMFSKYEPRISGWRTPIEDMSPLLPRDEFRANMIVNPMPGWETGKYDK